MSETIIKHYHENGKIKIQTYWFNGKLHRDPEIGPAYTYYDYNGQVIRKGYWFDGLSNNPYGPALSDYKHDDYYWYLNGEEYTELINNYLNENNLDYKTLTHIDFDIMWTIIL